MPSTGKKTFMKEGLGSPAYTAHKKIKSNLPRLFKFFGVVWFENWGSEGQRMEM